MAKLNKEEKEEVIRKIKLAIMQYNKKGMVADSMFWESMLEKILKF